MAETIKKAPASDSPQASANEMQRFYGKDSINSLPRQQKRLLLFLMGQSAPCSVADITRALGQTDPRGHIRDLRARGYHIGDVWSKSSDGSRFKLYFVKKGGYNGRE